MKQKRDRLSQWKADAKEELVELKGGHAAASQGSVASEDLVTAQELASVQDNKASLPSLSFGCAASPLFCCSASQTTASLQSLSFCARPY